MILITGATGQLGRAVVKQLAKRVAAELRKLLDDPRYTAKAQEVGWRIQSEDGVSAACDAIERRLVGQSIHPQDAHVQRMLSP